MTSEGDSDEGKTLADELESEWMSDSDSEGEEGTPVIRMVSLVARCLPQIGFALSFVLSSSQSIYS